MAKTVPLVHYLYTRLRQLGVESLHGVPGDYNLVALDYVENAGLTWIGDANELNAGYSADGYARVKGLGAILTTFGVGELSAINAIAGSYAEYVPVVHIAGSPSTASQKDHMLLHHTLGNGDFKVFARIYENVTEAQALLHDETTATAEIDAVLRTCLLKSRPVYIELPTDLVPKEVDASPLETPIDFAFPKNDEKSEQAVAESLLNRLYSAKKPVLLVDACVSRHRLTKQVVELVQKTGLPTFSTPMAKGTLDETMSNYGGIYAGNGSHDTVKQFVEPSDMVLSLGSIKSDFNTTGFTYRLSKLNSVDMHTEFVTIDGQNHILYMEGLLERLNQLVDPSKLHGRSEFTSYEDINHRSGVNGIPTEEYPAGTITHEYLWPALSSWLKPNDILITETGTSYLGVWDTKFPPEVFAIAQTLWGSIGYALPAAQGAALAARELKRPGRVILFEGDGSAQLTIQAIGTMLKHNLDIIIVLINNDGYTIERWVHGMTASYNDVPMYRYAQLPNTMGGRMDGPKSNARSSQAKTVDEIEAFWKEETVVNGKGKGMQFVEMFMPKEDAPATLKMVCIAAAKTNAG